MDKDTVKDARSVYRLPPCPAYDVEGMESWLTDLAAEGLHLRKDGFFAGIAILERREPAEVKIRLGVAPRGTGLLDENAGEPDEDARCLYENLGWEYVAARGRFHIYRTNDPNARELDTDPQVQAIALNEVRKRHHAAVLSSVFWLLLFPILRMRGTLLLTMLHVGSGFVLFGVLLALWIILRSVVRAAHLGKLRRKLLAGGELDHGMTWRTKAMRTRAGNLLLILLVVVWIGMLLGQWSTSMRNEARVPLDSYHEAPPFATMTDLVPAGEYRLTSMGLANTVEQWSDWLAPNVMEWEEIASVRLPDGNTFSGGLYVDYYDVKSPWLARQVFREYRWSDARKGDLLPLPDLGIDDAVAYRNDVHMPTLLLRQGSKVMRAMLFQTSESYTLSLEEWAQKMADSIR